MRPSFKTHSVALKVTLLLWPLIISSCFAITALQHRLYQVHFQAQVTMDPAPAKSKSKTKVKDEKTVYLAQVAKQIEFLAGTLTNLPGKGSLLRDPKVDIVNVDSNGITYNFQGYFLLPYKSVGARGELPKIYLPRSVQTLTDVVYSATQENKKKFEDCSDLHYGPSDFWYFFAPAKHGCPLLTADYRGYLLEIDPVNDGEVAFNGDNHESEEVPVHQLAVNQDSLRVSVFFSPSEDSASLRLPHIYQKDVPVDLGVKKKVDERMNVNIKQYLEFRNDLLRSGFKRHKISLWDKFLSMDGDILSGNPMIEEFTLQTTSKKLVVRIFSARSSSDIARFSQFASLWNNALKVSDVVIYNGHSGLGGNLSINSLANALDTEPEEIVVDPDKYQIYFLNGCATFIHYLTVYENFKNKNLDLFLNGVSASFDDMSQASWALVDTIRGALEHDTSVKADDVLRLMSEHQLPVFVPAGTMDELKNRP